MTYFNGGIHGWNGEDGYRAPEPCTAVYCDSCADAAIPLPETGKGGRRGNRHWGTGFRWAPYYGRQCDGCGKAA